MIRRANSNEVEQIMEIWLKGNIDAHPFISPAYWQVHYEAVAEAIAKLCPFVYVEEECVKGFIGLEEGFIHGLFIAQKERGKGVGGQLIAYCKTFNPSLTLKVYVQNTSAVAFYKRQGFQIVQELKDTETDALEYEMKWSSTSINR